MPVRRKRKRKRKKLTSSLESHLRKRAKMARRKVGKGLTKIGRKLSK